MTRRSAHVYPLDRVFFTHSTSSPAEQSSRSNTNSTTITTAMSLKERVSHRLGRFLSMKYDRYHHRHHQLCNDSSLQQSQHPHQQSHNNAITASNAATPTIKQTYDATPHLHHRHHASMPLTSKDIADGTNDDCYFRQGDQAISSLQMPVLPTALRPPPRPHYYHNRRAAIQQQFTDRCKSTTAIMFGTNSHFDIVRNDTATDDEDDDRHSFVTTMEQVDSDEEGDEEEDDLYPQQQVAMSVTILPAAMAAATAARSRRYRARAAKAAAAAAYL
ncbi:hypothetical protein K492DRAFT_197395 [Lichtheimia hyalospora FSU 10163]|nr:hypothetical protein K492DRAFT_197395 [Lichtheimia hyalospora FSU 10163]